MTPAQRRALARLTRQAARLEPALVAAILRAFRLARTRFSEAEVARLVATGRILEAVDAAVPVEVLERLLNPASALLREDVAQGIRATATQMPARAAEVVVGFNELNPRILDAVRALDTTSLRSLVPEVRQAVRETIEAGLQEGINPRQVARRLTTTIGLAPNQAEAVRNYRRKLEGGVRGLPSRTVLDRTNAAGERIGGAALRDRRFDGTIRRALADGRPLTPTQIDQMVAAYERRMVAFNAETHARTAAIESQKLGQQLAWKEAQLSGALDGGQVIAQWVTTIDGRERDEHRAMNGQTRPLDGRYSNGDSYPGETDPWNCRCTEVFRVVRRERLA